MAKAIMISNTAYERLKKLKEGNKSFSDVIVDLLSSKPAKTGFDLMKHFGALKGDKEYRKIRKEINAEWGQWQKKYA